MLLFFPKGGKNMKDIWKKWWLWLIIVVTIILSCIFIIFYHKMSTKILEDTNKTIQEGGERIKEREEREKDALNYAIELLADTPVHGGYSQKKITEQLEHKGFSYTEIQYAINKCGADWYDQAAYAAKYYKDENKYTKEQIIKLLKYDGFTGEQTEYGVSAVGY